EQEVVGPPVERFVSITVSPFHALIPFLELTAELRISRRISGALLGGFGKFLDPRAHPHRAREIGVQGNYYLEPTFRAFHFGVEVAYVHSSDTESATTFTGTSLAAGGFVGWKYIHRTGVTLLAQGGLALGVVEVRSPPGNEIKILPVINLNAGWSF
nr:hypothetical protein [Deltaproteobacteria bacterium]